MPEPEAAAVAPVSRASVRRSTRRSISGRGSSSIGVADVAGTSGGGVVFGSQDTPGGCSATAGLTEATAVALLHRSRFEKLLRRNLAKMEDQLMDAFSVAVSDFALHEDMELAPSPHCRGAARSSLRTSFWLPASYSNASGAGEAHDDDFSCCGDESQDLPSGRPPPLQVPAGAGGACCVRLPHDTNTRDARLSVSQRGVGASNASTSPLASALASTAASFSSRFGGGGGGNEGGGGGVSCPPEPAGLGGINVEGAAGPEKAPSLLAKQQQLASKQNSEEPVASASAAPAPSSASASALSAAGRELSKEGAPEGRVSSLSWASWPRTVFSGEGQTEAEAVDRPAWRRDTLSGRSSIVLERMENIAEWITRRQRTHSPCAEAIWRFMEDPESSFLAQAYDSFNIPFICLTVLLPLVQTVDVSPISGSVVFYAEAVVDLLFLLEVIIRLLVTPNRKFFILEPYNIIDILSGLVLGLRILGEQRGKESGSGIRVVLLCYVPILRLLKVLRRYRQFHLLLKAFRLAFEALPVLLFCYCVSLLTFAALIYTFERRDSNVDSLSQAMWLSVMTMTTVGYGDVSPITTAGKVVTGILTIANSLYLAVPLGIIGNCFHQVWSDRDRILLIQTLKRRLRQLGYGAEDIPTLFRDFDMDGDGSLDFQEFNRMVVKLRLGLSTERVVQLFNAFDEDHGGNIDDREFVRSTFPAAYHHIYPRECGQGRMTISASLRHLVRVGKTREHLASILRSSSFVRGERRRRRGIDLGATEIADNAGGIDDGGDTGACTGGRIPSSEVDRRPGAGRRRRFRFLRNLEFLSEEKREASSVGPTSPRSSSISAEEEDHGETDTGTGVDAGEEGVAEELATRVNNGLSSVSDILSGVSGLGMWTRARRARSRASPRAGASEEEGSPVSQSSSCSSAFGLPAECQETL